VGYLYTDALPPLDPPRLAELLHVGCFYGVTRWGLAPPGGRAAGWVRA
jgi:hypothetical protein